MEVHAEADGISTALAASATWKPVVCKAPELDWAKPEEQATEDKKDVFVQGDLAVLQGLERDSEANGTEVVIVGVLPG